MITKQEVKNKRKYLNKIAKKRVTFNKGDHRVFTPRLCVVCGKPLSSLVIREQKYITVQTHIRCHINEYVTLDVCADIKSCYSTLSKKGELINDVNGG